MIQGSLQQQFDWNYPYGTWATYQPDLAVGILLLVAGKPFGRNHPNSIWPAYQSKSPVGVIQLMNISSIKQILQDSNPNHFAASGTTPTSVIFSSSPFDQQQTLIPVIGGVVGATVILCLIVAIGIFFFWHKCIKGQLDSTAAEIQPK
ncbi:hypothetical protein HDU77_000665 [Chytriomyces hyalinus]|nr:hypothetical protein HDU77_000665 [Chytriomyces hyalinus]